MRIGEEHIDYYELSDLQDIIQNKESIIHSKINRLTLKKLQCSSNRYNWICGSTQLNCALYVRAWLLQELLSYYIESIKVQTRHLRHRCIY